MYEIDNSMYYTYYVMPSLLTQQQRYIILYVVGISHFTIMLGCFIVE